MAPRHYAVSGRESKEKSRGPRPSPHDAVADPFDEREAEVHTPTTGIVIGRINCRSSTRARPYSTLRGLEPGAEAGAESLTTLIPDLEEARATETPAEPPLG
jgi:hypothetical protein